MTMVRETELLNQITSPLLAWYDGNRRVLPWREEVSPYRTWVSEIMLQQTRVQAVLPYFQRFMEAAPDAASLAALPEQRLMALWQGLGYYNRARNLQRAAIVVTERYGGALPRTYDELRALPGIGDYTAGAILSIACGQAVPAVDGNVLRIAARLTGYEGNVLDGDTRKTVREWMAEIMPTDRPGDFNQALMDLGAAVCLPGTPLCGSCPLAGLCTACREGRQGSLPVRVKKAGKRQEERTVFLLEREGRTALRRRPDSGLLAGLWEYPNVEGALTETAAARQLAAWGLVPLEWRERCGAKHVFTHIVWNMTVYRLMVSGGGPAEWVWCAPEERGEYPMPTAFGKLGE